MSKKWLVPSIGFILILPLISFYYLNETPAKVTNKPRRILRNINELRSYMHPADSPQYQQYITSQKPQQLDELSSRRRLAKCSTPCPGCEDHPNPCICSPPFGCNNAACIETECLAGTAPPTEAPTLPPSMPPTPDRSTIIDIDSTANTPYLFVDFGENHFSYDSANTFCTETIGGGSTLATINRDDTRNTQQQQIDIMTALANEQGLDGHSCWIGLKWFNSTKLFHWQNEDGTAITSGPDHNILNSSGQTPDVSNWGDYGRVAAQLYWADDYCTFLAWSSESTIRYKWDIADCVTGYAPEFAEHCALCNNPNYLPYPTPGPTQQPTSAPSKKPTTVPTQKPTESPSKKPTSSPSKKPTTKKPTSSPTKKPTSSPTKKPTSSPTKKPTGSPTKKPTGPPTKKPTSPPTKKPTSPPTKKPTGPPTKKPTSLPTKKPTSPPTKKPTSSPTKKPTSSPTKKPTSSPTKKPTGPPTKKPTGPPTKKPTGPPTKKPTQTPSDVPTKKPTSPPTKKPTSSPTKKPTSSPTKKPTSPPTKNPTGPPTKKPTGSPTKNPTSPPTKNPTSSPTKNPTTGSPTKNPTNLPTKNPTTPPPTHPDTQICGATHSGGYNDEAVIAEIYVKHASTVIFDCSQSLFTVGHIRADDDNGLIDEINGTALTLPNQRANKLIEFTFTAASPTTSTYEFTVNCPTKSPTSNPSTTPTQTPTSNPTKNPTSSPSKNPTSIPSTTPTQNPTSKNPTENPSKNPTSSPSSNPSTTPTETPTKNPTTDSPTKIPTGNPTTDSPTKIPTGPPTKNPTTDSPTKIPTGNPTTDSPTKVPTSPPTKIPTGNPTTDSPTKNPTGPPTKNPTTDSPTKTPTVNPTTKTPTSPPSKNPTTDSPTKTPTRNPTTKNPTSPPSKNPTGPPSKNPTSPPTETPTTGSPTKIPTSQPSESPSDKPTASPTEVTSEPTEQPSETPTNQPTRTPTGDDDPCGDDRKEWTVVFPCAGQPRFQLVSTCSTGYAIELSLDKVFEVDIDKRGVGNSCNKFGQRKGFGADLDFKWDGGNFGNSVGLYTVDGEEREVIKNTFSAKLNKRVRRGRGGRKNKLDSWLNITVFYFIDERGGTFDLRNTGDVSKYITVEAFTLKYIIDSENWPFKKKSDLLAMQFTASVVQAEYGIITQAFQCLYDGVSNNYGKQGKGYGRAYGPWGDGDGWDGSSSSKHKSKGKGKGRRVLLHDNEWKRNEAEKESGCGKGGKGKNNNKGDCEGWGEYTDTTLTTYNTDVDNFAFGIDFRWESVLISLIDNADVHIESVFVDPTWDSVTMIHYFPKFVKLAFDGASLFYKPTFDAYALRVKAENRASSNSNNNHNAFGGEDMENQPKFKTQNENNENGMFTKLWNEMSWLNWIIVFGGILLLTVCICCSCFWICYKIKQNTHENNSFVKLE